MTFTGLPHEATDFYAQLELDNSKEFWSAHRGDYERHVKQPLVALFAELEDFGEAKIFRPHRDVRFSADKSPYKTHQGGYVSVAEATGWYAEVSADGFRVGGGCYQMDKDRLAACRAAIDDKRTGAELERVVAALTDAGWEVGGDQVKTAPRGWSRDHPRIALLRHTTLHAMRWIDDGDVVTSPALVAEVRREWEDVRPLVDWLAATT